MFDSVEKIAFRHAQAVNYQLLLQEQILSDDRATASWPDEFGQSADQVEQQEKYVFHVDGG